MRIFNPRPLFGSPFLRLAAWNILLTIVGLAVIAVTAETYLRLRSPFQGNRMDRAFVPEVGVLFEPGSEVRVTNGLDYWTVSRANSLGFLDREPIPPERAAESCHVAIMGDSFVAGREVQIADKIHVRLEELATQEIPELDITASAFGAPGTAQVSQLPFYDRYARQMRPDLVALVFVINDFWETSPILTALSIKGWDPDHTPYAFPERAADGSIRLRPPDPDWESFRLPPLTRQPQSFASRVIEFVNQSHFGRWLTTNARISFDSTGDTGLMDRVDLLRQRPRYESVLEGWSLTTSVGMDSMFLEETPPPAFREALEFTEFAVQQFQQRADSDGASLVILSTYMFGGEDDPWAEILNDAAETSGIPVISQHDYIIRQGGMVKDARFQHDGHWNAAGHQWAAEALLEYLKQNQEICDTIDPVDAEGPRLEK